MQPLLNKISGQIHYFTGLSPDHQKNIILSLLIVALFVFMRWLSLRVMYRHIDGVTRQYHWRRAITYITTGFAGVLIAVPTAAVLNILWKHGKEYYQHSNFFIGK